MLSIHVQRLAGAQYGLVHRNQLRSIGLTRHQVRQLLRSGQIRWVSPTVLCLAGAPTAPLRHRRMLAVLDAGAPAAISHLSAARTWGVQRRSEGAINVIRARNDAHRARPHVAIVHSTRRLPPHHIVNVEGIPTTTPARTIVDLANTFRLGMVARMLDACMGRRLVTIGGLAATMADVRSRGRRGIATLELLIGERRNTVPTESALERKFVRMLELFGEPSMRRQVNISDEEGWIGRVDFLDELSNGVIFIDGHSIHDPLTARRHDDAQTARLKAAGHPVERFSDLEVLYEPEVVLGRVRALRSGRLEAGNW